MVGVSTSRVRAQPMTNPTKSSGHFPNPLPISQRVGLNWLVFLWMTVNLGRTRFDQKSGKSG